jgi:hypothetical protein
MSRVVILLLALVRFPYFLTPLYCFDEHPERDSGSGYAEVKQERCDIATPGFDKIMQASAGGNGE